MSWLGHFPVLLLSVTFVACSEGSTNSADGAGTAGQGQAGSAGSSIGGAGGESGESGESGGSGGSEPVWQPGDPLDSLGNAAPRDFLDLRGLIHAHSPYSNDACDGEPRDTNGNIDEVCFEDLRRGMCQVRHDFAFFTDHRGSFSETDFPEVLFYRADRGDELVMRNGGPVANRAACSDGDPMLVIAGMEGTYSMPIGLERHVSADPSERSSIYGAVQPQDPGAAVAIQSMHDAGALVLTAHTENWTPDDILNTPLDGFEMYNVHANFFLDEAFAAAIGLLALLPTPDELPHSDLILIPIHREDPAYTDTWGTVLARGGRYVTTFGTDSHRNVFPQLLPDNERVDSFRRMMSWFSNHLLVRPEADGTWDDSHLKAAVGAARLYGVFEYMGFAQGFDFHATDGANVVEMGSEAQGGMSLEIKRPSIRGLDPSAEQPTITTRLLKAIEGGWSEVESAESDLSVAITEPGAYRAEVRLVPRHLREFLAGFSDLADEERPWIYSNAIYVVP